MGAEKLIELLNAATSENLEAIDAKIAEVQGQLDGLSAVRKVLSVRINGKPERGTRGPSGPKASSAADLTESRRRMAAKYLLSAGNAKASTLCEHVGIDGRGHGTMFAHPWFKRNGEYYALTADGRDAAAKF